MSVIVQPAKSILNRASGFIGSYDFTLNPYRGCQFGCDYCYAAAFSPNQQLRQEWGNWVMVKENAPQLLQKELHRLTAKGDRRISIYMSSVTDPYQPIEKEYQLTRQLLEIMVEFQPILVIQTRSPMIIRDLDLLKQLNYLRINISIPTASERVRKDFERRSPSVKARLKTAEKLKHSLPCTGNIKDIRIAVTMTPLLPSYPEDFHWFISRLEVLDRIVIQPFHAINPKSLVASTPRHIQQLKQKYLWWYDQEKENYLNLRSQLQSLTHGGVEIYEGKDGFGYD